MSIEDKANYLRIALGLQKFGVSNEVAERIIVTYEKILELGGDFAISDAVEIESKLTEKFTKKRLEDADV